MTAPLRLGMHIGHVGPKGTAGAAPFVSLLGERLGHTVEATAYDDYDALLGALADGSCDLAWAPPLVHARAVGAGGELVALCQRSGAITYRSALMVRTDSLYTTVHGLEGVRAAWVSPHSASGYLFPRLRLLAAGLDPRRAFATEIFCGSRAVALGEVVEGEADLCACHVAHSAGTDPTGIEAAVAQRFSGSAGRLRMLDITDPIPADGLVLGTQVNPEVRAAARSTLLTLDGDSDGREQIAAFLSAERLVPITGEALRIVLRLRAHVPQSERLC